MTAHATGHHNAGSITAMGFHDQPWADHALCAEIGGDLWFPEKDSTGEPGQSHVREAKAICGKCPVRDECLQWALETDQRFGLWGGVSPRERAKMTPPAATGTDGPSYDATDQAVEHTEQPAPRSYGLAYIGGAHAHRPIPLATDVGVRPAHQPKAPRPTGLDWSKHTAPEPEKPAQQPAVALRCRWCREPATDLVDDVCGDCRDAAERQFHAPGNNHATQEEPCPSPPLTSESTSSAKSESDRSPKRATRPTTTPTTTSTTSSSRPSPTSSATSTSGPGNPSPSSQPLRPTNTTSETSSRPELSSLLPSTDFSTPDRTLGSPVVEYVAQLLADTATSADPLVQMLRGSALSVLAALDHAHHPQTPAATPTPTVAAGPTPEPAPRKTTTTRRRPSSRFPLIEAKRLYLEEQNTCAQIATTLGSTVATVRKQLKAAGTPMRDDRARGSGGWNKKTADDDNPGLVDAVRSHYLDEQLTIERTAAAVGLSPKGLIGLMNRHGIERRPPANVAGQAPHWHKLDDQAVTDICDRYKAGDSTVILAEAYGVSTPTITNALRRSGVQLRTPTEARRLALTRKENQPA